MKRNGKPVFFIVAVLIVALVVLNIFGVRHQWGDITYTYIKGIGNVAWNLDMEDGVTATFGLTDGEEKATDKQLDQSAQLMRLRLAEQGISSKDVFVDYDKQTITANFSWAAKETDFDVQAVVETLGQQAVVSIHEGNNSDEAGELIVEGKDIVDASVVTGTDSRGDLIYYLALTCNDTGAKQLQEASKRLLEESSSSSSSTDASSDSSGSSDSSAAESSGSAGNVLEGSSAADGSASSSASATISLWMDGKMTNGITFSEEIKGNTIYISGTFTEQQAQMMANQIKDGPMALSMTAVSSGTLSPTFGINVKMLILILSLAIFVLVAAYLVITCRMPGAVSGFALLGQLALTQSFITGFFNPFPKMTVTFSGMVGVAVGVLLAIYTAITVAANIKQEVTQARSLDGALDVAFKRATSSVFTSHIAVILLAVIFFFCFGTLQDVTSFAYTILTSAIANFVMGVGCARWMLKSLSKFQGLRREELYGGAK